MIHSRQHRKQAPPIIKLRKTLDKIATMQAEMATRTRHENNGRAKCNLVAAVARKVCAMDLPATSKFGAEATVSARNGI